MLVSGMPHFLKRLSCSKRNERLHMLAAYQPHCEFEKELAHYVMRLQINKNME